MVGEPLQEIVRGVHGSGHQQGFGAREVAVDGLARDPEGAGDVGDAELGAALVDRLARSGEDSRDRLVIRRGRRSRPAMGAHGRK